MHNGYFLEFREKTYRPVYFMEVIEDVRAEDALGTQLKVSVTIGDLHEKLKEKQEQFLVVGFHRSCGEEFHCCKWQNGLPCLLRRWNKRVRYWLGDTEFPAIEDHGFVNDPYLHVCAHYYCLRVSAPNNHGSSSSSAGQEAQNLCRDGHYQHYPRKKQAKTVKTLSKFRCSLVGGTQTTKNRLEGLKQNLRKTLEKCSGEKLYPCPQGNFKLPDENDNNNRRSLRFGCLGCFGNDDEHDDANCAKKAQTLIEETKLAAESAEDAARKKAEEDKRMRKLGRKQKKEEANVDGQRSSEEQSKRKSAQQPKAAKKASSSASTSSVAASSSSAADSSAVGTEAMMSATHIATPAASLACECQSASEGTIKRVHGADAETAESEVPELDPKRVKYDDSNGPRGGGPMPS